MNITCLKLITGEEVIAKIKSTVLVEGAVALTGTLTLQDARTIAPIQDQQGRIGGIALVPFTIGNNEAEIDINFDRWVVATYQPQKDLADAYLQQTTKIALATNGASAGLIKS